MIGLCSIGMMVPGCSGHRAGRHETTSNPFVVCWGRCGRHHAIFCQGAGLHETFTFANNGYSIDTGVPEIDPLLNRAGIPSMMWTISLLLEAPGFGRALERVSCLKAIIKVVLPKEKTFAGVPTSAVLRSVATNTVTGDPYSSIALPGRIYAPVCRAMGCSPLNL